MGQSCFIVSPIGSADSEVRRRSDQVLKYIIEPCLGHNGFNIPPVRADFISEPGSITDQIMTHLIEDDLVIVDLTGLNPNVMYELAIRHATGKPYVQICHENTQLPFDVTTERTIFFNHQDLDSVQAAKDHLHEALQSITKNPGKVASPISSRINLADIEKKANDGDNTLLTLVSMVSDLTHQVRQLSKNINVAKMVPKSSLTVGRDYDANQDPFAIVGQPRIQVLQKTSD